MNCSAEENIHLTIKEFVTGSHLVDHVFPSGVPTAIAGPNWASNGTDEMSFCQKHFFELWKDRIQDIPIHQVIEHFDCIGFMDVSDAQDWLPIWMCASYYASQFGDASSANIGQWTLNSLDLCIEAGRFFLPIESIQKFVTDFGES